MKSLQPENFANKVKKYLYFILKTKEIYKQFAPTPTLLITSDELAMLEAPFHDEETSWKHPEQHALCV